MDRRDRGTQRRRFAIALIASVGLHALLLAYLEIDLPFFGDGTGRQVEVVNLPVLHRTPATEASETARMAGVAPSPGTAAPRSTEPEPAADLAAPELLATPRPSVSQTGVGTLNLAMAERTALTTAPPRNRRGLVLASGGREAERDHGILFQPASAAAREAERARGGDGLDGIGVVFGGGGADPLCKPGRVGSPGRGTLGRPRHPDR